MRALRRSDDRRSTTVWGLKAMGQSVELMATKVTGFYAELLLRGVRVAGWKCWATAGRAAYAEKRSRSALRIAPVQEPAWQDHWRRRRLGSDPGTRFQPRRSLFFAGAWCASVRSSRLSDIRCPAAPYVVGRDGDQCKELYPSAGSKLARNSRGCGPK